MSTSSPPNKNFTGRYDMNRLNALKGVEEWFMGEMVSLYKVSDEDSLPTEVFGDSNFDFYEVIDLPENERKQYLISHLSASCPSDAAALESTINQVLLKILELK